MVDLRVQIKLEIMIIISPSLLELLMVLLKY